MFAWICIHIQSIVVNLINELSFTNITKFELKCILDQGFRKGGTFPISQLEYFARERIVFKVFNMKLCQ